MSKRYLVGGPNNSGKSTFVLSLVERLKTLGMSAETIELDVWSNSYAAFRHEVSFEEREKRFDLAWDWKERVRGRLASLFVSGADVAFGDFPGKLGDAVEYMCYESRGKVDGGIVVSRNMEGIELWQGLFRRHRVPVVARCLTFLEDAPIVLVGMNRNPNPTHPDVVKFATSFVEREIRGFERFAETFRHNIASRSRTAKGTTDTSTSTAKKKLLKEGNELREQVSRNTEAILRSVWDARFGATTAETIRGFLERWHNENSLGLQSPDAYCEEQERLGVQTAELRSTTGLPYRVNSRYRTWEVPYAVFKLKPAELELAMDHFYRELSKRIAMARCGELEQAELLGFADHMIDAAIHPLTDGCGRIATATVMWLTLLVPTYRLPVFGTREEHYKGIADLQAHVDYYRRCLSR